MKWIRVAARILLVLMVVVLLHARYSCAQCKDRFRYKCICLNDGDCAPRGLSGIVSLKGDWFCKCRKGEELSLGQLANRLHDVNGTVESLFVEGVKIKSLRILRDALVNVNQSFVLVGTSVRSLPLGSLQRAGSILIIANIRLSNVKGLGNLVTVENDLVIGFNDRLRRINSLSRLQSIGRNLDVVANTGLRKIHGFPELAWVGGNLRIFKNFRIREIGGFGKLVSVSHSLRIEDNKGLLILGGMQHLKSVSGNVSISRNPELSLFHGLRRLKAVGRDLHIAENSKLVLNNNDNGLQQLEGVGGDVIIDRNMRAGCLNMLSTLTEVGRDVILSNVDSCRNPALVNLRRVGRNIEIRDCGFRRERVLERLREVGGSLQVISSFFRSRNTLLFRGLQNLCTRADVSRPCGVKIRNNVMERTIAGFNRLGGFNGSLSITGNTNLRVVKIFRKVTYLAKPNLDRRYIYGETEDVTGGLTIAFNPNLASVAGFDSLETVVGDVFIIGNPYLDRIMLKSLRNITGWTRFDSNSINAVTFVSPDPLPYLEPGCRTRKNVVPTVGYDSATGVAFATMLERRECHVEKLLPSLVGASIIVSMVIMSLLLSLYTLKVQYSGPKYHRQSEKAQTSNKLAVSILAMADLFSDIGFSVTAFVVWQGQNPRERENSLLAIGVLSALALVSAQGYMVVSVYIGLTAGALGRTRGLDGERVSLLRSLKEGGEMHSADWLLLFPGLLVLEAGVIKYLPWDLRGSEDSKTDTDGFPHEFFGRVAFIATLMEDVPLIFMQTAFIILLEGEDGWAITGAMGSMTISVADLIVKVVVPILMDSAER